MYTVGTCYNFSLASLTLYNIGTIEYRPATNDYAVRVGFSDSTGDRIFFNSYHHDFQSAHDNVRFLHNAKTTSNIYNIWAEVINVHSSPGPPPASIIEALALIYSFVF